MLPSNTHHYYPNNYYCTLVFQTNVIVYFFVFKQDNLAKLKQLYDQHLFPKKTKHILLALSLALKMTLKSKSFTCLNKNMF